MGTHTPGSPRILIRTDASATIGFGHVARMLALADALRDRGGHVRFVMREESVLARQQVHERGYVIVVPASHVADGTSAGDFEARDAAATAALLEGEPADVVVVDHYRLGVAWEQRVSELVPTVVAVDDLGRSHACAMLLDTGFGPAVSARYDGKLPARCVRLIGTEYALLASVYATAATHRRERDGYVRRVVVFFGGADVTGETGKVLSCLRAPTFAAWHADVVSLATGAQQDHLVALASARPHTSLHGFLPHLAGLYDAADLAIGAGGASTWERLALGVPSLVTVIAANQRDTAHDLAAAGAIHLAGEADEMSPERYHAALAALPSPLPAPAVHIDGKGAARVADILLSAVAARNGAYIA